jgi:ubiquinone/menaquinone biosynthesis C-methylase UbiE
MNEIYTSRFITLNDQKETHIHYPLPYSWWSRHYEYIWASQFVGENDIVLDAACGVCQPFKFYLVDKCKELYACDMDSKVLSKDDILNDIEHFVGKNVRDSFDVNIVDKIKITNCDMSNTPYQDKQFDKLFCISVLEHVSEDIQLKSLLEFKRVIKDNGLIILTVDYPDVTVEGLLEIVDKSGLKLYGDYDFTIPDNAINTVYLGRELKCIRLVLSKSL